MRTSKKIVSLILAVMMVMTMMSVMAVSTAFAAGTGSVEYTTLAGATSTVTSMSQLKDGTYKLLEDHTETTRMAYNLFAYDVTIDLNGYTFTSTATDCAITMGRAGSESKPRKVTFIDSVGGGKFVANNLSASDSSDAIITCSAGYNEINVNGAAIEGTACGIALLGSNQTLNVTSGSITVNGDDFAIATNGAQTKDATINISGGTITSTGATAIYQPSDGTLNISDGTITGTTAVAIKSGTANITGGTFVATGDAQAFVHNGNGSSETGDAILVENCNYPGGEPSVSISGGSFTSANGSAVASVAQTGYEPEEEFVSGGTFANSDGTKTLDDSYIVANKTYDDTTGEFTTYNAVITHSDDTVDRYASGVAAYNALVDGDTLKFYNNVYFNGCVAAPENAEVTIDFNGFNSGSVSNYGMWVKEGSTVNFVQLQFDHFHLFVLVFE